MHLLLLYGCSSADYDMAAKDTAYQSGDFAEDTSTGGGGVMIKGYDPVITEGKCVTTFMATDNGKVYFNIVEFETVAVQGGTLCTNGKWRAFDNSMNGTTPYRVFFKDGVFRAAPN